MTTESWWFSAVCRTPSMRKIAAAEEKAAIGILAFEIASLMSKVVSLWHFLGPNQIILLKEEIKHSTGIRKLVSDDEDYLMDLATAEISRNLTCVTKSVARLGKRCSDPVYHFLGGVLDNPFEIDPNWLGWAYRWKKMERKVKKMERFMAVTAQLYQELEVLGHYERDLIRRSGTNVDQVEFQQKVLLQRQEVKYLRELSPWIRTYDYTVRLLLRSLFTIVERIKRTFYGSIMHKSVKNGWKVLDAPPSTLGHAALTLRYANILILVEKLVYAPHLITMDDRDNLYKMLPASIRASLRKRIKFVERSSGWVSLSQLKKKVEWLAPLAHETMKWQSERNIEKQRMVPSVNVLLVQTFQFADRRKTEAEIVELLTGLTYISRCRRKLNEKAFLDGG